MPLKVSLQNSGARLMLTNRNCSSTVERIKLKRKNLYQQQLNEWEEAVKVWEKMVRRLKA
jgi:hypothetical protein